MTVIGDDLPEGMWGSNGRVHPLLAGLQVRYKACELLSEIV